MGHKVNRLDWAKRAQEHKALSSALAGAAPQPPFCPLMSCMVATSAQNIVIAGQNAAQLRFELLKVGCALGKDCLLWDAEENYCGLVTGLGMVAELFNELVAKEEGGDGAGEAIHGGDTPGGGPQAAPGGPEPGGAGLGELERPAEPAG